jgi:hypothetical protein
VLDVDLDRLAADVGLLALPNSPLLPALEPEYDPYCCALSQADAHQDTNTAQLAHGNSKNKQIYKILR